MGIQTLLKDDDLRQRMGLHCRKVAEEQYSLELQARRYVTLYEEAVKRYRQCGAAWFKPYAAYPHKAPVKPSRDQNDMSGFDFLRNQCQR